MKRIIVIVAALAVAVVAYVGVTWAVGGLVQSRLRAEDERAADLVPTLTVTEASYERGAFSSTRTVTYAYALVPPGAGAATAPFGGQPLTLTLRERIRHGPLAGGTLGLAVIDTEIVLPEAASKALAEHAGDWRPVEGHTVVGLGGGFVTTIESRPLQVTLPDDVRIDWKGLQGTFRRAGPATEVAYEVAMPGFELAAQGVRVAAGDARMSGAANPQVGSIWLAAGTFEARLGSLEVTVQDGPSGTPIAFALRDLRSTAVTSVADNLLTSTSTVTGHGSVGEVQLQKVELEGSVRRLHAASYQKVMAAFARAQGEPGGQADPAAILAEVKAELGELLRHDPEYAMDRLVVELDGKRGELSFTLGVQGATAEDASLPPQMILLSRGRLDAAARLPVEWVMRMAASAGAASKRQVAPEQVANLLGQLASRGFVTLDGEHVASNLHFAEGALTVNGVPVPLPGQR